MQHLAVLPAIPDMWSRDHEGAGATAKAVAPDRRKVRTRRQRKRHRPVWTRIHIDHGERALSERKELDLEYALPFQSAEERLDARCEPIRRENRFRERSGASVRRPRAQILRNRERTELPSDDDTAKREDRTTGKVALDDERRDELRHNLT